MGPSCRPPPAPSALTQAYPHARAATPMFAPVGLWVESGVGPPVEASPQCREQAGGGRQGQRGRGHGRGQRRAKGARARWVWTKGLHARGYEFVLKDTGNSKSPGPGQGAQPSNAHLGNGRSRSNIYAPYCLSSLGLHLIWQHQHARNILQASSNRARIPFIPALCERRLPASWPLSRRDFLLPGACGALIRSRGSWTPGLAQSGDLGFREGGHALAS